MLSSVTVRSTETPLKRCTAAAIRTTVLIEQIIRMHEVGIHEMHIELRKRREAHVLIEHAGGNDTWGLNHPILCDLKLLIIAAFTREITARNRTDIPEALSDQCPSLRR